jgi:integrase
MQLNRLTAVRVQQLRKPGFYPDGGGLYLQVTQGAAKGVVNKSWLFRFSVPDASKPRKRHDRWAGLGPIGTVSLGEARAAALEARQLRRSGIDPIEHRKAARAAQTLADAKAMTFDQCRDAFISANSSGWKNEKHRDQWTNTLTTYVTPVFGKLPVAAVDTALVMRVIQPLWATKPETASRVRQRIERVLSWAKVGGFREGDNPARWKGHLDQMLPNLSDVRVVRHHPSLPYAQVGAYVQALRERHGVSPRALEFTILTGLRTDAVIKARWSEIDLVERVWTVPPERLKRKKSNWKPHRVWLSDAALKVLAKMGNGESDGEFVFPGDKPRRSLSNWAMLELVKEMEGWVDEKGEKITPHGFRATLRTWAAERTGFQADLVRAALGQTVGNKVDEAYQRGELFEKRQRLMDTWADYCASVSIAGNVVVPMRKA